MRHGTNESWSYRDEGDNTSWGNVGSYSASYAEYELYRLNSNTILWFVNSAFIAGTNAPGGFADDYAVYFSADGHTKPNNIIIDWVEVENA